jgi:hypothetical protein
MPVRLQFGRNLQSSQAPNNADPDIPILLEAKGEYAKLQ